MSAEAIIGEGLAALAAEGIRPFDVHAHTGADIDGTTRTCEEHVRDLEALDGRSIVFPLCVTSGYPEENRRVVEECRRHPDRLVPFARLDPGTISRAEHLELVDDVLLLLRDIRWAPADQAVTEPEPVARARSGLFC